MNSCWPPQYDFAGRFIERTVYFYSAWCWCGDFAVHGSHEQVRRAAVRQHLHDVGHDNRGATGRDRLVERTAELDVRTESLSEVTEKLAPEVPNWRRRGPPCERRNAATSRH